MPLRNLRYQDCSGSLSLRGLPVTDRKPTEKRGRRYHDVVLDLTRHQRLPMLHAHGPPLLLLQVVRPALAH